MPSNNWGLGIVLLVATVCQAGTYHNGAGGYTLTYPANWEEVPSAKLNAAGSSAAALNAAFHPTDASWPGPVVVVQALPYPDGKQPRERDLDDFVKGMTKGMNQKIQSTQSNMVVSAPQVDRDAKKFVYDTKMSVPGGKTVKTQMTGYLGGQNVVLVAFSAPADDYDKHIGAGQSLMNSLSFDAGSEFKVTNTAEELGRLVGQVAGILIVTGVLLAYFLRKKKTTTA
jgi:hypothetical protein